MPLVAGHMFNALTPSERCRLENCEGIASLVELMAIVDVVQVGDKGVAHVGSLAPHELKQMQDARETYRAHLGVVVGF